jgi:hypothetical protein
MSEKTGLLSPITSHYLFPPNLYSFAPFPVLTLYWNWHLFPPNIAPWAIFPSFIFSWHQHLLFTWSWDRPRGSSIVFHSDFYPFFLYPNYFYVPVPLLVFFAISNFKLCHLGKSCFDSNVDLFLSLEVEVLHWQLVSHRAPNSIFFFSYLF